MKESEAKGKKCWNSLGSKYSCLCMGRKCMAWSPDIREERMDCKLPNMPEGTSSKANGWIETNLKSKHDNGVVWIRYHELDTGNCGALPVESGCFYPE